MRYTASQAAAKLGVSLQSIYRYVAAGKLGCIRTDGRVLTRVRGGKPVKYLKSGKLIFDDADLERWEAAQRVGPARSFAPAEGLKMLKASIASASPQVQKLLRSIK